MNTEVTVETEASAIGWTPKEKFRGDPEKWVDAQTFLDRGHQIMPILRKTNERLEAELRETKGAVTALKQTAAELQESLKTMTDFQAAEVKRQVDERIKQLRADKSAAIKEGDHELAAAIDEDLDTAKDQKAAIAAAPPPTKKAAEAPTSADEPPQWAKDFAGENTWLGKDGRRTSLFLAIAEELRQKGVQGRECLDRAKQEMEETLSPTPASKTESHSGGGGGGGGGGPKEPSYNDLPPEAKTACNDQDRKMVGAGKPFKTQAEWRKHYATVYLGE